MAPDPMPESGVREDGRLVYVVTAAGVEALQKGAAAFDREPEPTVESRKRPIDVSPVSRQD